MGKTMKWILVITGVVFMMLFITSAMAETSGTCGENLTWTLSDNGELRISGTGAMKNYYYTSNNFRPWGDATTAVIDEGVTSIGDSAFQGCSSLTSITIPDGVTSIGVESFRDCSSLTSITIPDGVTSIGNFAFDGCSSLTSITIPDSVTSIGDNAF